MVKQIIKHIFLSIIISFLFVACDYDEKMLPESDIYINMPEDGYEIEVFDTVTLSPKITYDYGSTYSWELDGQIISTEKDLILMPEILRSYNYVFTVNNDRGTQSINIQAQSMFNTDIEDIVIKTDTFGTYPENQTFFTSKKLNFIYSGVPIYETFSGFVYSNLSGFASNNNIKNFYSSYNLPKDKKNNNFVVFRQKNSVPVYLETADGEDHLFRSLMVNNTAIIDQNSEDFKVFGGTDHTDPDWFKLTIKGFNKEGIETGSIEFYLADYRANSKKEDYIIKEWKKLNLTSLGKINKLEFSLSSSDVVNNVMRTPAYACIDDIKIIE